MERREAIRKLQQLVGKELHELADEYGVTIYRNNRVNKGWAGHVFERHLQLPIKPTAYYRVLLLGRWWVLWLRSSLPYSVST